MPEVDFQKLVHKTNIEVKKRLRRYGRHGVKVAAANTPVKTGYTASRWTYKMTGLPNPSLRIFLKTQKAEKRFIYAVGKRTAQWIVSTEGKMKFTPAGGLTGAWADQKKTGGKVIISQYFQKSRRENKKIKREIDKVIEKAMDDIAALLVKSGLPISGSYEVT